MFFLDQDLSVDHVRLRELSCINIIIVIISFVLAKYRSR